MQRPWGRTRDGSGELVNVVRVEIGEVHGPCEPGAFQFYYTCDGKLLEYFKQGSNMIKFLFCKMGSDWWVESGINRERMEAGRPATRWVSSTEVKPGQFVPVRFLRPLPLDLAPAVILTGLGLSFTGLW